MKKRGIFKNDIFIFKNVPRGTENAFVSKKTLNQFFIAIKRLSTSLIITTFACGEFFRPTGYIFDYESVVFENTSLFHVWGTFIDPNLCWKSKFGSVNLLYCKLPFLPFYGLLAAFMAFSLKPMIFSEQLSAN